MGAGRWLRDCWLPARTGTARPTTGTRPRILRGSTGMKNWARNWRAEGRLSPRLLTLTETPGGVSVGGEASNGCLLDCYICPKTYSGIDATPAVQAGEVDRVVLHAFQKKSKKGIATPKKELDLIQ